MSYSFLVSYKEVEVQNFQNTFFFIRLGKKHKKVLFKAKIKCKNIKYSKEIEESTNIYDLRAIAKEL